MEKIAAGVVGVRQDDGLKRQAPLGRRGDGRSSKALFIVHFDSWAGLSMSAHKKPIRSFVPITEKHRALLMRGMAKDHTHAAE